MKLQVVQRLLIPLVSVLFAPIAGAHAPVFSCSRDGNMIHCEAGYTDGSSAVGRGITILDTNHRVLSEGTVTADGTYDFEAPNGIFHVIFDGGEYHEVTLYSLDIE